MLKRLGVRQAENGLTYTEFQAVAVGRTVITATQLVSGRVTRLRMAGRSGLQEQGHPLGPIQEPGCRAVEVVLSDRVAGAEEATASTQMRANGTYRSLMSSPDSLRILST